MKPVSMTFSFNFTNYFSKLRLIDFNGKKHVEVSAINPIYKSTQSTLLFSVKDNCLIAPANYPQFSEFYDKLVITVVAKSKELKLPGFNF